MKEGVLEMGMFHHYGRNGKRPQRGLRRGLRPGVRFAALFLCLSVLAGFFPAPASAEESRVMLSSLAGFESIILCQSDPEGSRGDPVPNGALIQTGQPLVLHYTYHIEAAQIGGIDPDTEYYLDVSPHLALPNLGEGKPLTIKIDDVDEPFGTLHANGRSAWVTFLGKADGGTVLSELAGDGEGLSGGWFDLTCSRVENVPDSAAQDEKDRNLYAMKFETTPETFLSFGYAENEPVTAKAVIKKDGKYESTDKTITWEIAYTPWQNPDGSEGVAPETPFELRDTIDASLHSYSDQSVRINGVQVPEYSSRDAVSGTPERYVIVSRPEGGGGTTLTFGGTDFSAGTATQGNPAKPLIITYETKVNDELLLPGRAGGAKVQNTVQLFAGPEFESPLDVGGSAAVAVRQPVWLKKEGKTTRHTDGTGSTTHWTVTFYPNGFTFGKDENLTLHDQLPEYSELADPKTVTIKTGEAAEREVSVVPGENRTFTVPGIETDGKAVTIAYDTHIDEKTYEDRKNLGSNAAWFTFAHGGDSRLYETSPATTPVGSGDGSGTPVTDPLVKTGGGYDASARSITWTVKINPHKTYLAGADLTDDLSAVGLPCARGHKSGLELAGGTEDIVVKVDGREPEKPDRDLITLEYDEETRILSVKVGNIGPKAIELAYTTKVCDPCVFANNSREGVKLRNTIAGTMTTGWTASSTNPVSASGEAAVRATVLTKKAAVYDYAAGRMSWEIEVDAAGLPMRNVVLTDDLPAGLTYADGSFSASPESADASASASADGRRLTICLGTVEKITTVAFDTEVNPEAFGFSGDGDVTVSNTVRMNGEADGVVFAEVSHRVEQTFVNHGLVKSGRADRPNEFIQYEVLINPHRLALPASPSLEDTLDRRLQLDRDSLRFYRAEVTETTADQRPDWKKLEDTAQPLKITRFDPESNCFAVQLPIAVNSRDAYVLTYTADIMELQAGSYSNSVRFDGGPVLLGGEKGSAVSVSGGGGGGGGAVAGRRAVISVEKTDGETGGSISGVSFTLYQWDDGQQGLPYAQGTTDGQGKLSFKVKPNAVYKLEETGSAPGYGSEFGWTELPQGARKTDGGLLITAGAAKSEIRLNLTNEAHTTDIVFRLVNKSGIPIAGETVRIFAVDPTEQADPDPVKEAAVSPDGTVKFPGIRRGAKYYIQRPDGGVMRIDVPAQTEKAPTVTVDGSTAILNADYQAIGTMAAEQQWELTVKKAVSGGAPLAGAVIGLYADAACQTLLKTGVSGPDGIVAFSGLVRGQDYWLKEKTAPAGYHLNQTSYRGSETDSTVTIENNPVPTPADPGGSGSSGGSGKPGRPGRPGDSPAPGTPGDSAVPGVPVDSGAPDVPIAPGDPVDPGVPGGTGGSDAAGGAEGRGGGADDAFKAPQTGDHTGLLAAVTALSGLTLAAMTGCRLWGRKKREEE